MRRGDNPTEERKKKTVDKIRVHDRRRVRAGQGALAKAKADAEKEWIVWDADPAEMADIFGGDEDGQTS